MKKAYAGFTKYNKPVFYRQEPLKVFVRKIRVESIRVHDEEDLPVAPEGHRAKLRIEYQYDDDKEIYVDIYREEFIENKHYEEQLAIWQRAKKRHENKLRLWNEWFKDFEQNEAERKRENDLKLLAKLKAQYES